LTPIAVHSDPDANARHVALADESFPLGGAAALDSYLRVDKVLEAARATGAHAVHPGYGFLAENADFARAIGIAGLVWVGPTPASIDDMGDKERARLLARAAGLPILPGSARFGTVELAGLEQAGRDVGFPLLVKAAAGGGGIGMRRVDRAEDLLAAVQSTQGMAQRAFSDPTVYLERYVAHARHVEVQVFGFGDGTAVHVHERDCSIQRRFQKIVEESPAPHLPAEIREAMCASAVALCRQERYRGAGTVEFVVDADSFDYYFLEMNTRIQVEHPVSEMISGLDLVSMQLQFALGMPLPIRTQSEVAARGHAIECRLYAERPAKGFIPSTGTLSVLRMPTADASLRVDSGVREGDTVTHHYDPMIAKLIVHADDRPHAIDRMRAALQATEIAGVQTNRDFLLRVMADPAFAAGDVSTGFVDQHKARLIG
jgi:3-methylcrotonyl-CoA carboxylase alpha subunit